MSSLESLLPILLRSHLTLVSALVLLHDGEELQCPLGAPGDVQQLEPPVRGEGGEPVGEDLVIWEADPGDARVLHIGHTAVEPHRAAWHKKSVEGSVAASSLGLLTKFCALQIPGLFLFGFKTWDICFCVINKHGDGEDIGRWE